MNATVAWSHQLLGADERVATCPLYQMLETVRAYAMLELTAAGERDDALEGLARYCTGEASRAAEGWSDRRRPNGWIACATISRTTVAR
jgi:predicted ATPase